MARQPHHPSGWEQLSFDKGKDPAGEYAEFSRIAFRNLRAADPAGRLIVHDADDLDNGTEKVYRTGAYASCDGVEFHAYLNRKTGFAGDGLREELQRKPAPLPRPLKPVCLTEGQGRPAETIWGISPTVMPDFIVTPCRGKMTRSIWKALIRLFVSLLRSRLAVWISCFCTPRIVSSRRFIGRTAWRGSERTGIRIRCRPRIRR